MWVTAVFCLVLYSLALCFLFSSNSPTQRVIVVEDIVIPSGSYNVVDNKAGVVVELDREVEELMLLKL